MTARTFRKLKNVSPEKVTKKDIYEHKMWIFSAPFFAMCYIDDTSCLAEDTTLNFESFNKPKEKNANFL